LPSIRNLAKDLRISVITTKRAYDELEREGYINTIPGKGTFIAARNIEIIKEEYLRRIEEHLRQVMQLADFCSLGEEDIIMMYRLVREGDAY
jgi:GntR family transcriptional regulator